MPGIIPRLKALLFSGFGVVTRLIAVVCFMAGLIPKNHECFRKDKQDSYGLRHILGIAAANVKFEWKHADQVLIFSMIVCGTVMMLLYIMGMVFYVMMGSAHAMGAVIADMFVTANPEYDIAFRMLDSVFGIPDLFNSCISTGTPCFQDDPGRLGGFPNGFQRGLHELFRFFSFGIFFIALPIFLYHVVHYVYDVTQKGHWLDSLTDTPDGASEGFSWLPIRYIVCFGLLIPFGQWGLNSAQWMTLYTAKFASGMATNAWIEFNNQTGDNPTGEENVHLVSEPNPLDTSSLIKGLFMMRACSTINAWAYNLDQGSGARNSRLYVVRGDQARPLFSDATGGPGGFMADRESYTDTAAGIAGGSGTFPAVLEFSGFGDIHLVHGDRDDANPARYKDYPGGVLPVCGEVSIPVTGTTGEAIFAAEGYFFAVLNILADVNRPGVGRTDWERAMFTAVMREYVRTSSALKQWINVTYGGTAPQVVLDNYLCGPVDILGPCDQPVETEYWKEMMEEYYGLSFAVPPYSAYDFLAGTDVAGEFDPDGYWTLDNTAWDSVGSQNPFMLDPQILGYGWGGAGLWFNKISERNGSLYTAVTSLPQIQRFPLVMERLKEERRKTDPKNASKFCENYDPRKSGVSSSNKGDERSQFTAELEVSLSSVCYQLYDNESLYSKTVTNTAVPTGPVESAIASIISEFKVFDVQENNEVTPMAQLSSIGRVLVDKGILGFVGSAAVAAFGGMMHAASAGGVDGADMFGSAAGSLSGVMTTFAVIGLTGGLVLHYMLPFMPFVYFFFAVGGWVKIIFEAMVGVPLWALAHMRTGGPGLPGEAASGGYFLLLDIFIRPIATVISLIGAWAIFSGMAFGVNIMFNLITVNLFGTVPLAQAVDGFSLDQAVQLSRGVVDQFFLSMFYIAIIYVCATSSFKLIDLIPDGVIRWAGHGVQSSGASDQTENLYDDWQFQLPTRFQSVAQDMGKIAKQVVYDPFEQMSATEKQKRAVEEAQKKQKEQAEKDSQDQAQKQQLQQKQSLEDSQAEQRDAQERMQRDAAEKRNRDIARAAEARAAAQQQRLAEAPRDQVTRTEKPINGAQPTAAGQTPQGQNPAQTGRTPPNSPLNTPPNKGGK